MHETSHPSGVTQDYKTSHIEEDTQCMKTSHSETKSLTPMERIIQDQPPKGEKQAKAGNTLSSL